VNSQGPGCASPAVIYIALLFFAALAPDIGGPLFIGVTAVILVLGIIAKTSGKAAGSTNQPINNAYQPPPPSYAPGDGRAFEQHIRNRLVSRGYQVRETPGSGDYGVDLLADHYGHKVAIQAKNHAKPVGVRAVQEAHAGLRYYGADEAWVVSRSGFTQQAQTLAKATGVRLVDVKHL